MWPWGHAALGYLLYTGWQVGRGRDSPTGAAAGVAVFGALLPDMVDKPLAWTVGVLPAGRTLGHSLVVLVPAVALLWWVSRRRGDALPVPALAAGWASHVLGDGLVALVTLEFQQLRFALWPLFPPPDYETGKSFLAHIQAYDPLAPLSLVEFGLVALALLVWVRARRARPETGGVLS